MRRVISGQEIVRMGGNRDAPADVDLGFPEFIGDLLWGEALSEYLPPFLSFQTSIIAGLLFEGHVIPVITYANDAHPRGQRFHDIDCYVKNRLSRKLLS